MISANAWMLTTLTKILECSPTPHTCIFTVSPKVNRTINVFLYPMHLIFSLSLYLYQGGIQGVCVDADSVFGGRKDLSPEYSSFKRPSIHHKRDPHVHRGWYIYLTILVIIWMCTSYWILLPLISAVRQQHPSVPSTSWASRWPAWRTRSTMRSCTWGPSASCPSSTACSRSTVTLRTMIFTRSRRSTS